VITRDIKFWPQAEYLKVAFGCKGNSCHCRELNVRHSFCAQGQVFCGRNVSCVDKEAMHSFMSLKLIMKLELASA
jgi:hypothetical protein